jgi:hypothetical protein
VYFNPLLTRTQRTDSGWLGFTLQHPYYYDGTSNFIVDISAMNATPIRCYNLKQSPSTPYLNRYNLAVTHYKLSYIGLVRAYQGFTSTIPATGVSSTTVPYIAFDIQPTAVGEVVKESKAFRAYPNPAQDKLSIENAAESGYELRDVTGRLLLQGTAEQQTLDISRLTSGMYLLKSGKDVLKITKQ